MISKAAGVLVQCLVICDKLAGLLVSAYTKATSSIAGDKRRCRKAGRSANTQAPIDQVDSNVLKKDQLTNLRLPGLEIQWLPSVTVLIQLFAWRLCPNYQLCKELSHNFGLQALGHSELDRLISRLASSFR